MWAAFLSANPSVAAEINLGYDAWHFCDNQQDADKLVQLVLNGKKRATCSAHCLYEIEAEPLPQVGRYSIVTDWSGTARCVIQLVDVQLVPFDQVTAEFAALEGEGDQSLGYWRQAHQTFFERELKAHQLEFSEALLLVCERFELLHS